jgi:hypothetical protein
MGSFFHADPHAKETASGREMLYCHSHMPRGDDIPRRRPAVTYGGSELQMVKRCPWGRAWVNVCAAKQAADLKLGRRNLRYLIGSAIACACSIVREILTLEHAVGQLVIVAELGRVEPVLAQMWLGHR